MKMKPVDVQGVVYSSGGLRFGGFPTERFLKLTEDLEEITPGIRDKIIAEAHYLAFWLHRLPELAFLIGILYSQSLVFSLILFVVAFGLEILRFRIFGASLFASFLCQLWNWFKWPLYFISFLILWPINKFLFISIIAFLVLEGLLGIFSTILLALIRIVVGVLAYRGFLDKYHWVLYLEYLALQHVIDRWRMKLLPPKEALKFSEASKEDIKFYELNSKETHIRAYINRPFLEAIVSCFWLLTVGGIIMMVYSLFTGNLLGIPVGFLVTAISLILWYILHNRALKHPKH